MAIEAADLLTTCTSLDLREIAQEISNIRNRTKAGYSQSIRFW